MPLQSPFETLDAEFNTEPTELPETSRGGAMTVPEETDEAETVKSEDGGLDNKDYMVAEMKALIMGAGNVIQRLDADIKIGSSPRHYEVYAKLMDSLSNSVSRLADIEASDSKLKQAKSSLMLKETMKGVDGKAVQNNFFFEGTSSDMLKWLKEARKSEQIEASAAENP